MVRRDSHRRYRDRIGSYDFLNEETRNLGSLVKWTLGTFGIAAIILAILWVVQPSVGPILTVIAQKLPSFEQARPGLPFRVKIPKIDVDATVEYVGLTPQGAMEVTKGPDDVAWYHLGPRPGEKGSAVIAGHEGWKNGISAVFDDLHLLRKGDEILVQDEKGVTTTFIVRETKVYAPDADATNVFNSTDGKIHLNLITCEGAWNVSGKSYANRRVIFADAK